MYGVLQIVKERKAAEAKLQASKNTKLPDPTKRSPRLVRLEQERLQREKEAFLANQALTEEMNVRWLLGFVAQAAF